MVPYCTDDYGLFNFEHENYTLNWATYDNVTAVETNSDLNKVYDAFKYMEALDSSTYPVQGVYTTYFGGGYFLDFKQASIAEMQTNISALKASGWIDRQTRALSAEFSLYNGNLGLYAHISVLFEILPTGSVITSWTVDPLNLTDVATNVATLNTLANIIYLAFVVLFIVLELNKLRKSHPRKEYFKQFWNWVELAIIACSWASFSMYLYRMYAIQQILEKMKNYSPTTQISLQTIKVSIINHSIRTFLKFNLIIR
jgi:hypothetical protein